MFILFANETISYTYSTIISYVTQALIIIFMLMIAHYVVFSVIGVFGHKKYKSSKINRKYGVIISARNEQAVIGNLIKSVRKNDYPQELITIFVVAHNCTDNTAEIARENGAVVYEYNNDEERTKGFALKHLFKRIDEDYGIQSFDGYIFLDADNILSTNYITKMNDAFEAEGCDNIITSFRNSKNFGSNIISGLYGIFFITCCRLESRGRTICRCSTRVQGTGFLVASHILKDGWNYVTLTEDWEFSADQVLLGRKIFYCDEAVFYDEQPTSIKIMLRQRLRWSKGHLLVCLSRGRELLKSLFGPRRIPDPNDSTKMRKNNKGSKYDFFCQLPLAIIMSLVGVAFTVLKICQIFIEDYKLDYIHTVLYDMGRGLVFGYIMLVLSAILIFCLERKRIKHVNFFKKILMVLMWPFYLALSFPLMVVAMFAKNLGWKAIPHTDTTDIEKLQSNELLEASAPPLTEIESVSQNETASKTLEASAPLSTEIESVPQNETASKTLEASAPLSTEIESVPQNDPTIDEMALVEKPMSEQAPEDDIAEAAATEEQTESSEDLYIREDSENVLVRRSDDEGIKNEPYDKKKKKIKHDVVA